MLNLPQQRLSFRVLRTEDLLRVKSDHLAHVKPPEKSGEKNLLVCVEEETGSGARTVRWNPRALGTGSPGEVSDIKADFLPCREEQRQNSADWLTGC